jgi:hypothetical protein
MESADDDRTEPVLLVELAEPSPTPPPRLVAETSRPGVITVASHPPGATVVIVTAGRARVAGLTPIRATVDLRARHDLVLAANGFETCVWRLPATPPTDVEVYLRVQGK